METLPVRDIIEHGPGVRSFYFEQTFEVQAGQFVNIWLPETDEKPFSVSRVANGQIEVSVKAYGPFTKKLMQIQVGEYLGVRGPFGNGFSLHDNALLVGGGIGIAPLRILGDALLTAGKRAVPLLGAAMEYELIFKEDFQDMGPGFYYTDDGSYGKKGLVTEDLERIVETEKIEFVYAAGPEIMFLNLKEQLDKLDLPYEFCMERYMKCGIGICGQCVLDDSGVRLCVEGPVLNQDDLKQVSELGLPHRDATGRRVKKRESDL